MSGRGFLRSLERLFYLSARRDRCVMHGLNGQAMASFVLLRIDIRAG